ncbi:hypothetical protein [Nocardia brasiliensis]|uniref:hypothetical protein n=1 Tax=Nocardia brasiliensis TaxID=37326 RepID=UPI002458CFB9|nr:hypothetical protein [Nocardia brasiliensis]
MNITAKLAGIAVAVAAAPLLSTTSAQAVTPDTVYFSYGDEVNCAITADGIVGCDVTPNRVPAVAVGDTWVPLPVPINQVIIDQPELPAHPGVTPKAFTLPGGNPPMSEVKTGAGYASIEVAHGGATCVATGGHYSGPGLSCTAKGHAFSLYATGGGFRSGVLMS